MEPSAGRDVGFLSDSIHIQHYFWLWLWHIPDILSLASMTAQSYFRPASPQGPGPVSPFLSYSEAS